MLFPLLLSLSVCSSWGEASLQHVGSKQPEENSGLCPDHWIDATLSGLGCLYFNSSSGATWEEASNWCQHPDNNASLLEIWSELQLDFVQSELILLDNGVSNGWWTGATDLGREGRWYWAGSLATVGEFIWWSGGQPNGGTGSNCMWLEGGYSFFGADLSCGPYEIFFICQRK